MGLYMDLIDLKAWLLGTIWGVIVLGAMGSILGVFLLYVIKVCWGGMAERRLLLLQKIFFPIRRDIYQAETLVNIMGPRTPDGKYVGYLIVETFYALLEAIAFFMSLGFSLYVYIAFSLERPVLLSFFVGLSLFISYDFLRTIVSLSALISEDIFTLAEKLGEESPKNIHEWRRLKLEQEAAKEDAKRQPASEKNL